MTSARLLQLRLIDRGAQIPAGEPQYPDQQHVRGCNARQKARAPDPPRQAVARSRRGTATAPSRPGSAARAVPSAPDSARAEKRERQRAARDRPMPMPAPYKHERERIDGKSGEHEPDADRHQHHRRRPWSRSGDSGGRATFRSARAPTCAGPTSAPSATAAASSSAARLQDRQEVHRDNRGDGRAAMVMHERPAAAKAGRSVAVRRGRSRLCAIRPHRVATDGASGSGSRKR